MPAMNAVRESPTSWKRSSPTTSGRCRRIARCCSSSSSSQRRTTSTRFRWLKRRSAVDGLLLATRGLFAAASHGVTVGADRLHVTQMITMRASRSVMVDPLGCSQFDRGFDLTSCKRHVAMKPKEVLALCREKDVKAVDLRFMDFPGLWQHFTIPVDKLDEDVFEDGLGFDGSSIRGWQAINESDMLVVPQPETAFLDPFTDAADAGDDLQHSRPDHARRLHARSAQRRPQGGQLSEEHRHRRHLLHRPRGEFFIFDDVRFDQNAARRLLPHRQHRRRMEPRPRRKARTSATSCATRKATSRCRRPTS